MKTKPITPARREANKRNTTKRQKKMLLAANRDGYKNASEAITAWMHGAQLEYRPELTKAGKK